jgi:hypothetical protein
MFEKQIFGAAKAGFMLFGVSLSIAAVSLALVQYFGMVEFALIYPAFGVFCLFCGTRFLRQSEVQDGGTAGGGISDLFRSVVVASIVFAVPAQCWSGVIMLSQVFVGGMVAVDMPRSLDFIAII